MASSANASFWDHIEALRWALIRCAIVVFGIAIAAFLFKDFVFDGIVFAPADSDFITYTTLCKWGTALSSKSLSFKFLCFDDLKNINLMSINLSAQLFTHISVSFYISLLIAFPYLMIELWMYVSPALYRKERKPAIKGIVSFVVLFFTGVLLAYYVIFPLTLHFLAGYQVSERVPNEINLDSYISTFLTLTFMLGVVFEMPIVAYFLAKIGVLTNDFLTKYRKVAFVVVLVAAALITPSTDAFTMLLVAMPLQLLYEFSRLVVKRVEKKNKISDNEENNA